MFDRVINHHQHGADRITATITEKRAPTDESVRLLKEMQEKAEARIAETIHVMDGVLDVVCHRIEDLPDCMTRYKVVYSLNGHKREVMAMTRMGVSDEDRFDAIWKAVSEDIARLIVQHHYRVLIRNKP